MVSQELLGSPSSACTVGFYSLQTTSDDKLPTDKKKESSRAQMLLKVLHPEVVDKSQTTPLYLKIGAHNFIFIYSCVLGFSSSCKFRSFGCVPDSSKSSSVLLWFGVYSVFPFQLETIKLYSVNTSTNVSVQFYNLNKITAC
jgi:hypothetical protein